MTMRGKVILATMLGASAALAGCVSAPAEAPAWYAEQDAAATQGYPDLHDVPRTSIANTNARHWSQVERDVVAAGAAMRASPRAQPAGPAQPDTFVEQARQELEESRASHEQ